MGVPLPPTGFEGWLPIGGITGLLTFLFVGFAKGWILTKGQVDRLQAVHDKEISNLQRAHEREITNMKERYEQHLTRTVELYRSRAEDSREREKEWRDTTHTTLEAVREVAPQLDAVAETQRTLIDLFAAARKGPGQ